MSLERKKQFVEVAYNILKEEGPEGVKIRRVAREMSGERKAEANVTK